MILLGIKEAEDMASDRLIKRSVRKVRLVCISGDTVCLYRYMIRVGDVFREMQMRG